MDLIQSLNHLGLTKQEAVLYIELCQHDGITGYEAAKLTGISRSNAYSSLSSLTDKGYACLVEGNPVHYFAVPKSDLLMNARRDFEHHLDYIDTHLSEHKRDYQPYLTITSQSAVINKLKNMILTAKLRLYISCTKELQFLLQTELADAKQRGLKVVILSDYQIDNLASIYYPLQKVQSVKLIVDTKEVIAGSLEQSIYSKNPTFVAIIRETFVHEIDVIKMKQNQV